MGLNMLDVSYHEKPQVPTEEDFLSITKHSKRCPSSLYDGDQSSHLPRPLLRDRVLVQSYALSSSDI